MKAGFAKTDITPRVGVELAGFGAFINRHSIGMRDRLCPHQLMESLTSDSHEVSHRDSLRDSANWSVADPSDLRELRTRKHEQVGLLKPFGRPVLSGVRAPFRTGHARQKSEREGDAARGSERGGGTDKFSFFHPAF